jgi:hypothetical protein
LLGRHHHRGAHDRQPTLLAAAVGSSSMVSIYHNHTQVWFSILKTHQLGDASSSMQPAFKLPWRLVMNRGSG